MRKDGGGKREEERIEGKVGVKEENDKKCKQEGMEEVRK